MNQDLPRTLGPYRLIRRLGHGGMCEVFEARVFGASGFERRVAIKTLLPSRRGDASYQRLLIEEARLGAHLHHRNLLGVEDFGVVDGVYYLRMPLVDGLDLSSLLARGGPLTARHAVSIVVELALGLHALHNCVDDEGHPLGLVHRDVNPTNILLSRDGGVRLGDFGVAKATGRADITRGNVRKGTYAYMSPEQLEGRRLTPHSDLFGLGVTFVEMLTGHRPYDGAGVTAVMEEIRRGAEPDLDGVSDELRPLLSRCLAHDPDDRFEDAAALLAALDDPARRAPLDGALAIGGLVRAHAVREV
jgi:serine/threonine-protein kinase